MKMRVELTNKLSSGSLALVGKYSEGILFVGAVVRNRS